MDTQYRRGIRRLSIDDAIELANRQDTAQQQRKLQQIEHNARKELAIRLQQQQFIAIQQQRERRRHSTGCAILCFTSGVASFCSTAIAAYFMPSNALLSLIAWTLLFLGLIQFCRLTVKSKYPPGFDQLRHPNRELWVYLGFLVGIGLSLTKLATYATDFIFLR